VLRAPRESLIVTGVLLATSVAYAAVVHRYQSRTLTGIATQVAAQKAKLEADAVKARQVAPMARQVEQMKTRYNKDWDRKLPASKELPMFLRDIAGNLAQAKLTNGMIQPGNPYKGSLYNCLPITMKFEGDFLSLASFLKRVDQMPRLTRIENLLINPSEQNQANSNALAGVWVPRLSIELGINIYFTEQ
jgi:Tfp pilus assembly protein PilO